MNLRILFLPLLIALFAVPYHGYAEPYRFSYSDAETTEKMQTASTGEYFDVRQVEMDRQDLEAFIDGLMASLRLAHNIAGATVAIVQDGEMLFSKGYGWADVEQKPDTLFVVSHCSSCVCDPARLLESDRVVECMILPNNNRSWLIPRFKFG